MDNEVSKAEQAFDSFVRMVKRNPFKTIGVIIFIAILIFAYFYIATLAENMAPHSAPFTAQGSVATSTINRPKLSILMLGSNVFVPDNTQGFQGPITGIALNTKIWNTGSPSVATNWMLIITPQGGTPVIAQLTEIPKTLTLTGTFSSGVIHSADELDIKAGDHPVGDVPVQGTLLFYAKVPQAVVENPTTQLELSVQDIYDKISTTTQIVGEWLGR